MNQITDYAYVLLCFAPVAASCMVRYLRDVSSIAQLASLIYASSMLAIGGFCIARIVAGRGVGAAEMLMAKQWKCSANTFAILVFSFEGLTTMVVQVRAHVRAYVSLSLSLWLFVYVCACAFCVCLSVTVCLCVGEKVANARARVSRPRRD